MYESLSRIEIFIPPGHHLRSAPCPEDMMAGIPDSGSTTSPAPNTRDNTNRAHCCRRRPTGSTALNRAFCGQRPAGRSTVGLRLSRPSGDGQCGHKPHDFRHTLISDLRGCRRSRAQPLPATPRVHLPAGITAKEKRLRKGHVPTAHPTAAGERIAQLRLIAARKKPPYKPRKWGRWGDTSCNEPGCQTWKTHRHPQVRFLISG